MGLITAEEYKASLNDGREVYYKGERIENVATHPDLSVPVNVMAIDYEMAEDPQDRKLAVMEDPETGEPISRYYYKPQNAEDLLNVHELIVRSSTLADGYIPLAHDIGADALNAIEITANILGNQDYIDRIQNYRKLLQEKDLATCAGVTDVKGNRMLRPSDPGQAHPDFYVHVVEKNTKGIIVRGAKMHITGAAYCNDIFVIPCRAMSEEDKDYAVAFAVPANTKGIKQVCRPFTSHISPLEFPNKRPVRVHTDSLIIFDDVLVPWERVFLCGEWKYAATMVYNFALMHRRTGCAYRIPLSEQLVGVAAAIAEYNGISSAPHVREKLTDLVIYLETLKSLSKTACYDYVMRGGVAVPNPIATNMAKYHFAHNYHDVVKAIQDLTGGLVVTAPTYKDYQLPQLHDFIDKYLIANKKVSAENRLRMVDLIRRITRAELETICLHGEGSPIAERMTIFMEAREVLKQCKELVEEMAQVKKEK
ncbi:MAG: 4-hydroxybutyryl-CoA dehydratase [Deltaproteobacteria bacterium]|nr:4-hydroxybutyryl-CoA dehydratase [Deltaproteobacteria bacterium]MBW1920501.1 4-hydroxybutyryl-CoA dehydratase [Deltaproteobacteria bacterium]